MTSPLDATTVYLDYNASTPVHPGVFEAMTPWLTTGFGNPGCSHRLGREAKAAVEDARQNIAELVGVTPEGLVFTSGATEANNAALFGFFADAPHGTLIVGATEHPAVLKPAEALKRRGIDVRIAPCDRRGVHDPDEIAALIPDGKAHTTLVSIMTANNETGVIQPIAEIARAVRAKGARIHSDASQAVGKIPVDARSWNIDLLTLAGHKFYAPKGVGALWIKPGAPYAPSLFGGGQEAGRRPGTENVASIVGMGQAAKLHHNDPAEPQRWKRLVAKLLDGLHARNLDFLVFGESAERLDNTLMVGFKNTSGPKLVAQLDDQGFAVSSSAACHDGQPGVSHVLAAMKAPPPYALGAVRFSLGRFTTPEHIDALLNAIHPHATRPAGD